MLTPAKITNHHFEPSGRNAYKAESVDSFIKEVAESYDQMFRENGEMYKKINLLAQRLEEYRNDEDNIRNALLTAQRAAEKITREAKEKADALVAEVQQRTDAENEKLNAAAKEILERAKYQAESVVADANSQAKAIVEKAVTDSKEASVNARSEMIKEVAALEMMKQEVTKFKQQILGEYAAQLELINKLPETVIEKVTEQEKNAEDSAAVEEKPEPQEAAEAAEKTEKAEETVAAEEIVEPEAETKQTFAEEKAEEPEAGREKVSEPVTEKAEVAEEIAADVVPEPREAESMNVEELQQMIDETEDTDADYDSHYEDEEELPKDEEPAKFVVPNIDEESDEELDKIVDNYASEEKSEPKDIMFTKPKNSTYEKEGFKLKFENIDSYAVTDDGNFIDDLDDDDLDDDDNDGGLASKIKGFFKK